MPLKRTGGESSSAPKRTRFAPPPTTSGPSGSASGSRATSASASADGGDDQFLDADITEANRGAKKREKRALKDTQGYGSDSSDDEDGVVPSRRPGAKDEDGDEEMDMFADEPADKPTDAGKGKGKEKAKDDFMDLEEIEGQEFTKPKQALDDDDSDSEDEGGKRDKKTGLDGDMGELTPFNMKKEMTEGRFTKDGQEYTENEKDPHEKHDHWLDSMDKDAIKLARRAHRERERLEKEREEKEDEVSGIGSEAREQKLMRDAVALMERGETVLEALQRLGKEEKKKDTGKKKSWAERQKERKEHASDSSSGTPFAKLSAIVSDLSAIGQLDVYSLSRESIQRMLPREPEAPSAPRPPPDTRQFQYRFSLAYMRALPEGQRPVEREVFGPFSAQQLNAWKITGFFGSECENVELRLIKDDEQPWGTWKDVMGA